MGSTRQFRGSDTNSSGGKHADRTCDILDRGKRSWNKNDDAAGDGDVLYTDYVLPLRSLREEGLSEDLSERTGNYRGRRVIDRVDLRGSINLDYDIRRDD
jgi:hypothetical protein